MSNANILTYLLAGNDGGKQEMAPYPEGATVGGNYLAAHEAYRNALLAGIKNQLEGYKTGAKFEDSPISFDSGGIFGIFGGPKAVGWAKASNKFSSLADKKPRFEIDDSKSFFTGAVPDIVPSNSSLKLYGLLRHPELFERYPFLKKVNITKGEGSYNPGTNTITIPSFDAEGKKTLLHEIQHAIQNKEGFAYGGSSAMFDTLPVTVKEAIIGSNIGEITHPGEWKKIFGSENPLGIAMSAKELMEKNLLNGNEIEQINKVANKHGFDSFDSMLDFLKDQNHYRSPEGQYSRLAGEIEAVDVAKRSATERSTFPPYESTTVPIMDWIVKFAQAISSELSSLNKGIKK